MLVNELFNAYYNDGRVAYGKTLDWIYGHQNNAKVQIRPCIWLSKSGQFYAVDYVGNGSSCTLAKFCELFEAEAYREKIGNMSEAEFKQIINTK